MSKYITLNDDIYRYLLDQRSYADDPILAAVRTETQMLGSRAGMAISAEQGSFLTLLAGLVNAHTAIEIGTFTGTSSISIARGLARGGTLHCFDQSEEWTAIARRFWQKAGLEKSIQLHLGNARELVPAFHPPEPIDLVFVDADREYFDFYYETLLPRLRPGGLIIFDNLLRGGDLADPARRGEPSLRALHEHNRKLATDPRVQSVLLPIADGLHLARKL
jgi:caffeoyl-CoA O-methyltransferase